MNLSSNNGRKAIFLVEAGFCEREFIQSVNALKNMDINCRVVSAEKNLIRAWNEKELPESSHWGDSYASDHSLKETMPSDYDILVIPGGIRSIEKLKLNNDVRSFVSSFVNTGKPVIAYNCAIDLLAFNDLVSGYSVVSRKISGNNLQKISGSPASSELVVSKNLVTLSKFREVEDKIKNAVQSIIDGKPYVDKVVSSDDLPVSHKVA